MKLSCIVSKIDVLGYLWMPNALAATTYTLSGYDIENMRDDDGSITRDSVEIWLDSHSGDFSSIADFSVTIGDNEFDSSWQAEESEIHFNDCMFGDCYE